MEKRQLKLQTLQAKGCILFSRVLHNQSNDLCVFALAQADMSLTLDASIVFVFVFQSLISRSVLRFALLCVPFSIATRISSDLFLSFLLSHSRSLVAFVYATKLFLVHMVQAHHSRSDGRTAERNGKMNEKKFKNKTPDELRLND